MTRPLSNPGSWPRLMRAQTAADYVDEKSVETFRRGVGNIYPSPIKVSGKGYRWLREDLDRAIDGLRGRTVSPQRSYETCWVATIHDR